MIAKIISYVKFLKKVNIIQFFYLNYFCTAVIRMDGSKIIPYKNAVIDIDKNAKIYLAKGDIELGCNLLKRSKMETRIRLRENAIWNSVGGCKIFYDTTIEILKNAMVNSNYFTMNSNSILVSEKQIDIGDDVMIGRNVMIYDSDFHQILNSEGVVKNSALPVKIGDHVWLATNVVVLSGVIIGADSIIGAGTVVNHDVPSSSICYSQKEITVVRNYGNWKRERP